MMMNSEIINTPKLWVWVKDPKFRFIDCNENFAEHAGVDSPKQLKGKDDTQLPWRKYAKFYQRMDSYSLAGNSYINQLEKANTCKGKVQVLVTKAPMFDRLGKCIGIMASGVDVTGQWVTQKNGYYDAKKEIFYLGKEFANTYLTKNELKVLRLVLLGHTSRKVAELLGLSSRTIEDYTESLKRKLQCTSKSEIIVTAIKAGIFYLVDEKQFF